MSNPVVPANDEYNSWTWREVKAALVGEFGDISEDQRSEIEAMGGIPDPEPLFLAAQEIAVIQDCYANLMEVLRIATEDLLQKWTGDAAYNFYAFIWQFHDAHRGQYESLADAPLGDKPIWLQVHNIGSRLYSSQYYIRDMDAYYAAMALGRGAGTRPDGLVAISDTPEVEQAFTDSARLLMNITADEYSFEADAIKTRQFVFDEPAGAGTGEDYGDGDYGGGDYGGGTYGDGTYGDGSGGGGSAGGGGSTPTSLYDYPGAGGSTTASAPLGPAGLTGGAAGGAAAGGGEVGALGAYPGGDFSSGGYGGTEVVDGAGNVVPGLSAGPNGSLLGANGAVIPGYGVNQFGEIVDSNGRVLSAKEAAALADEYGYGSVGAPVLDADNNPVPGLWVGEDGTVIGADGEVIEGYSVDDQGRIIDADGHVLTAQEAAELAAEHGYAAGLGSPVLDAYGNPIPGFTIGEDGTIIGPDGKPLDGYSVDEFGRIVGPDGELLTPDEIDALVDGSVLPTNLREAAFGMPGYSTGVASPFGSALTGAGSFGAGTGATSGVSAAGGAVTSASGASGAGSGMMPFMPMGGAGGQAGEKGRDRSTWLKEDDDVWSPTDDNTSPEVLG